MAITLERLRAQRVTSFHGPRLGLDANEWLLGPKGMRLAITAGTAATTATTLPNYGIVTVASSTDDTWTLADPVVGGVVHLRTGSSSTGVHTVVGANATFLSSDSSTGAGVVMVGGAAGVTLVGLTTALWAPMGVTKKTTAAATLGGVQVST